MKTKINRRSANDEKWQETKKKVRERDHYECQLCHCLTGGEYFDTTKACEVKSMLDPTDCAHIEAVGYDPEEVYNTDNILFMCRWHHNCLDNLINPFTGSHMDDNMRWWLWYRAKNRKAMPYDESVDWHDFFYNGKEEDNKKETEKTQSLDDIIKQWWK